MSGKSKHVDRKDSICSQSNNIVAEGRSNNLPGPGSYEQHDVVGPVRPTKLDGGVFTPMQHSVPKA